jgi:UDP-N-acetylglucosamine:LPS N-acetylglucosamine transferase
MQSKRRARKALIALDADVIFTTHWSTAFYASELEHPPYVVMLCPDVYSNGMFNVDVNDLLIPSEVGKADAERTRMYGGGNIAAIDFPIRNEAKALYGKKDAIRKELGIDKNEFVVTMSDGGYGLANMEATVNELLKLDAHLTVIALCGTNKELYERLRKLKDTGKI